MKFEFNINKTPLFIAIKKGNYEIVQLLFMNEKIDINDKSILICFFNYI